MFSFPSCHHLQRCALLLFLASLLGLVILLAEVKAVAQPRAAHAPALHQVSRRELARAQHPDLFNKRYTGDPQPSSGTGGNICGGLSTPIGIRSEEQVLNAREMASFLMGRGTFTSPNSTTYEDFEYAEKLRKEASNKHKSFHRIYNVVKDSLGNKLLEASVPHYKKWKNTLQHGELVYMSPNTGIRAQDSDELEHVLLEDPDFIDIQVHGFHISKRFFEVVHSYWPQCEIHRLRRESLLVSLFQINTCL